MVKVNILVFASLRDSLSEASDFTTTIENETWPNDFELKDYLLRLLEKRSDERSEELGMKVELKNFLRPENFLLAIDEEYTQPGKEINLREDARIALIPPVCGG